MNHLALTTAGIFLGLTLILSVPARASENESSSFDQTHSSWNKVLKSYVTVDGATTRVNYAALKKHPGIRNRSYFQEGPGATGDTSDEKRRSHKLPGRQDEYGSPYIVKQDGRRRSNEAAASKIWNQGKNSHLFLASIPVLAAFIVLFMNRRDDKLTLDGVLKGKR